MAKLLYLVTEDWYFCSHRLELAKACVEKGYEVFVLTQVNDFAEEIEACGIHLVPITFPRSFRKPWLDLIALLQIYRAYWQIKPDIVHHVALKPVIYGSLISSLFFFVKSRVVINAVTGLGSLFLSSHKSYASLTRGLKYILCFLLSRKNSHLIVQNHDDEKLFLEELKVSEKQLSIIRGAGVDIRKYKPVNKSEEASKQIVILVARMLKDKGVEEFIQACRLLKERNVLEKFVLVGRVDNDNPSGITLEKLVQWQQEGVVEWWNEKNNMSDIYAISDIVVLPSYREGLPKVLLEAAASGLPIVTTDVPGCREIVVHEENGLLVPVKNVTELADAIEKLIHNPELRSKMGNRGREMIEADFSSEIIINQTLNLYEKRLKLVSEK